MFSQKYTVRLKEAANTLLYRYIFCNHQCLSNDEKIDHHPLLHRSQLQYRAGKSLIQIPFNALFHQVIATENLAASAVGEDVRFIRIIPTTPLTFKIK